jgi:hypothetical protein
MESPAMADLKAVHGRLRGILAPYAATLAATKDSGDGLTLELPGLEGKPWGYVAGTRLGKRYVSFHLMGVYAAPELLGDMSPELRRRMQGKSCFNFSTVDETLFGELAALTARAIPRQIEIADSIRRSPEQRASLRAQLPKATRIRS